MLLLAFVISNPLIPPLTAPVLATAPAEPTATRPREAAREPPLAAAAPEVDAHCERGHNVDPVVKIDILVVHGALIRFDDIRAEGGLPIAGGARAELGQGGEPRDHLWGGVKGVRGGGEKGVGRG